MRSSQIDIGQVERRDTAAVKQTEELPWQDR